MIHMRKSDSKTTEEFLKLWVGITKKTSKKIGKYWIYISAFFEYNYVFSYIKK